LPLASCLLLPGSLLPHVVPMLPSTFIPMEEGPKSEQAARQEGLHVNVTQNIITPTTSHAMFGGSGR
jgi:hypothetical protein